MTTTPTSGAADLPEALRSIQRFEVVDCIDDKHVPAVIPNPHGPWVRYEDHIASLAAGQATAAQPAAQQGVAYAEPPDERAAFEAWYIAQVRSKTSTTNDWSDDEIRGAWLSRPSEEYRSSFAGQSWEAWQARASHEQAPAGAGEAAEHYRNAIARACEGWTMPDGLRKHLETALWSQPTTSPQAAEGVPAVEREQERIAFKDAHRHLDMDEVPDAWGRPMFKHPHVEASWLGWIARASHGQAPAMTMERSATS